MTPTQKKESPEQILIRFLKETTEIIKKQEGKLERNIRECLKKIDKQSLSTA